jgi:carboxypeptidase Taq
VKPRGVDAYHQLEAIFEQHYHLKRIDALLQWDTAVTMPDGSAGARAQQFAALQQSLHAVVSGKRVAQLLASAERSSTRLSPWQQANLREMRALHLRSVALTDTLRSALSQAAVLCESAWRAARAQNDYAQFAKPFARVLELVQRKAEHLANAWCCEPYEALMREYDEHRSLTQSESLFQALQQALPPLIQRAQAKQTATTARLPALSLLQSRQNKLCHIVLRDLGFDFNTGRLDQSQHPFTEGGTGDIRVTTHFDARNACKGLLGAVHEYGHAAYDAGLPAQWHTQPVGQARGMSLHEGMALFYEMALARTPEFIHYLERLFEAQNWPFDKEGYSTSLLQVAPGPIRIDADELTYPAHIALRYGIERSLMDGTLRIADLPEAWNSQMQTLLGITPTTLAEGCLQDIHWSMGLLGYFPSYAFGAVYGANLYQLMLQQHPDVMTASQKSPDFKAVGSWLKARIASHGAFYAEHELCSTLGLDDIPRYLQHLQMRYC